MNAPELAPVTMTKILFFTVIALALSLALTILSYKAGWRDAMEAMEQTCREVSRVNIAPPLIEPPTTETPLKCCNCTVRRADGDSVTACDCEENGKKSVVVFSCRENHGCTRSEYQ